MTARAAPPASPEAVAAVLPRFIGEVRQVPPVYSALKRDGKTLHRLARAGQEVPTPEARTVTITRLQQTGNRWLDAMHEVDLEIDCGSGTYIRSLARDIGRAAGSVAHLGALRRTRIGPFPLADAATGIMGMEAGELRGILRPMADALPHLPRLTLTAEQAGAVLTGAQPEPGWLERLDRQIQPGGRFTLLDPDGRLVAVGEVAAAAGVARLVAVVGRKED